MAYKALYRKYRPSDFNTVKGQKHIVKTIKNALEQEKFSHAYLFSGPRGTGKTTIAKIIAKAVNCNNYPTAEPCNECESCKSINNGSNPNVIEMDAASNNGVDEIREIINGINFVPSNNKYKVYIIDEVHMLSTGAFNALLKTLEEPPSHALFILCTTEVEKIPQTIISRTQRFDFKTISVFDIAENLSEICEKENIKITDAATNKIAVYAEGGMRDALSLLDECRAYSKEISVTDVNLVSGFVGDDNYIELLNYLNANEVSEALALGDSMINNGKEVNKIVSGFILFLRDVLLYKNHSLDEADSLNEADGFSDICKKSHVELIFYYVSVFSSAQKNMKYSLNAKTNLDLAIIEAINHTMQGESGISNRLTVLENKINLLEQSPINIQVKDIELETETKKVGGFSLDTDIVSEFDEIYDKPKHVSVKREDDKHSEEDITYIDNKEKPINKEIKISNDLSEDLDQESHITKETIIEEPLRKEETTIIEDNEDEVVDENAENQTDLFTNLFDGDGVNLEKDNIHQENMFEDLGKSIKIETKPIDNKNPYFYDTSHDLLKRDDLAFGALNEIKVIKESIKMKAPLILEDETDLSKVIFDVKKIENVLSYATTNRKRSAELKKYVISKWLNISLDSDANINSIAQSFSLGVVQAVSSNFFIISYNDIDVVNELMRPDIYDKIKHLLRKVYNAEYDYLAIPEELWIEKRKEFVDQIMAGVKEPMLTPIDYPGLQAKTINSEEKPSVIKDAIDFVGEDKVIVD